MDEKISLGNRMKMYEQTYKIYLPKKNPVIIRIDEEHYKKINRYKLLQNYKAMEIIKKEIKKLMNIGD